MDKLSSLDPMTIIILVSATLIIGLVLFAKAIKVALKLVVVAVMLVFMLYFLRQAGML